MNINWIKLDVNILDDSKIKIIRKYPAGDQLFIIWIGLLCLAMKSENAGMIEISNGVPYTPEDLSVALDIDLKTIQLALQTFQRFKMIEILDDKVILVINFNKHQNLDKILKERELTRERVKKFRDSKKCNALQSVTVTQKNECNADVTQQNKNKNKNKKKNNKEIVNPQLSEVIEYFKENGYKESVAKQVYEYYNCADWHDSKGSKVLNWKQKVRVVWFKPENLDTTSKKSESQLTEEQKKQKEKELYNKYF